MSTDKTILSAGAMTAEQRYEELKARYTDEATNNSEYEAACQRAAKEAGL